MLSSAEWILQTATSHWKTAAATVGVLLYALLALSQRLFYAPLGLDPGEAGFGYSDTLIQSALLAFGTSVFVVVVCIALILAGSALMIGFGALVLGVSIGFGSARALILRISIGPLSWLDEKLGTPAKDSTWRKRLHRGKEILEAGPLELMREVLPFAVRFAKAIRQALARDLQRALLVFVLAVIVASVLLAIFVPLKAWHDGHEARAGKSVAPIGLPFLEMPLLSVRAQPVKVVWPEDESATDVGVSNGACLIHLGTASDSNLFYLPKRQDVFRIPAGSVSLTYKSACP